MSIKFRMAAWSDAAGRPNNEDSFLVSKNIANQDWTFTTNETLALDEKGAVLVVCDGMGGMNAGEVASAVAIETVKEWFAPEKLTLEITKSPETLLRYVKKTIIACDQKIKAEAKADPEKEGMGSTIVLAWLFDKQVYVGWCGDSRAYRYHPLNGLERLSHDHSYVQELVDAGKLTPEMAMEHPQSNIITRSLGDTRKEAQPDARCFSLCNHDIILLCSDGLCGIMHDSEIGAVIARNAKDMGACRDALLSASAKKGWTDNVTIALCQIVSGGAKAVKNKKKEESIPKKKHRKIVCWLGIIALVLLLVAFGGGYFTGKGRCETPAVGCDSIMPTDTNSIVLPEKVDSILKIEDRKLKGVLGKKDGELLKEADTIVRGNITPIEDIREKEDSINERTRKEIQI